MSYACKEHRTLPWNDKRPRSLDTRLQGQRTTALPHLSRCSAPFFPSAALPQSHASSFVTTPIWNQHPMLFFLHRSPCPLFLALVFANKVSHSFMAKSATVPPGFCSKTQLLEELETWSSNSLIPFLQTKHKHLCSWSWCILHECPVIFICFVRSSLLLLLVLQRYHMELPSTWLCLGCTK